MERFNLKKLDEVEGKEQYRVEISSKRKFLTLLTAWRPVRLSATGSSTAERRARVLPMNQSSDGLQSSE
jgi:hypothetical protein